MLVNMNDMLAKANAGHYAVPAININNLEWIGAVLDAAQEMRSPVILGVSSGAARYMFGWRNVVNMVENVMQNKKITVPVALHVDHGTYEACVDALNAGFSSVMFDGSKLPFAENVEKTKEIVKLAKKYNATVEAEVGSFEAKDGTAADGELADTNECTAMASQTGICCLAAGIGNIHGIYPDDWKGLNFDKLIDISRNVNNIPLVLHGGTGIPKTQIKKAIELGICKVNVNTECQLAFAHAIRTYVENRNDLDKKAKGFDPRKLLKPACQAIKETVIEKIKIFGSENKA
ncbi:MAG: class II fructose-1,6-bisphosphate aldolase [Mycoplasma sp.]|nr:class II fructose-1,6-bisphosphate aldolase [Candidatus Hennigella equi]